MSVDHPRRLGDRAEAEPLQAVIEAEAASDSPRKALIGRCNQLLDEAEGDQEAVRSA